MTHLRTILLAWTPGLIVFACLFGASWLSAVRADIIASFDGNDHDTDDFGALPVACAILADRGDFPNVNFNSHFGGNNSRQATEMRTSAFGARGKFNTGAIFYDHSPGNMAAVINANGMFNRTRILLGGPAEVVWRGLQASNRAKHKYVEIITHSGWNNNHKHSGTHNLGDIQRVFKTVRVTKIPDQNRNLSQPISSMYWARDSANPNMNWIYSRVVASRKANGTVADISDAGLAMYAVTGNKYATMADVRRQIEHK